MAEQIDAPAPAKGAEEPKLTISGSRLFAAWLANSKASLAFTTYQAGKVFFIGSNPQTGLSIFERTFAPPLSRPSTSTAQAVICQRCGL